MPGKPFKSKDPVTRWFLIGRERLAKELSYDKLLNSVRGLKLQSGFHRAKASLMERGKNVIEIDSDCAALAAFKPKPFLIPRLTFDEVDSQMSKSIEMNVLTRRATTPDLRTLDQIKNEE